MKQFDDLTPEQQAAATTHELESLLGAIMEGAIRFNDKANKDGLQRRIESAGDKANAMQTPWFWGEYILDTCRDDLEGIARASAEDAIYLEDGEYAIRLPEVSE